MLNNIDNIFEKKALDIYDKLDSAHKSFLSSKLKDNGIDIENIEKEKDLKTTIERREGSGKSMAEQDAKIENNERDSKTTNNSLNNNFRLEDIGKVVTFRNKLEIAVREGSDIDDEIQHECNKLGMDFMNEYENAQKRVQFKDNLDKNHVTNGVGSKGYFKDDEQYKQFLDECRELELDPRSEILHMEQRQSLREDMQLFSKENDGITWGFSDKCESLGLSFYEESRNAVYRNLSLGEAIDRANKEDAFRNKIDIEVREKGYDDWAKYYFDNMDSMNSMENTLMMDSIHEIKVAIKRVKFRNDTDQNHVVNGVGPKGFFKDDEQFYEFLNECKKLKLDWRSEITHMERRQSVRKDIQLFTQGNSDINKESLKKKCEKLGLSFDKEETVLKLKKAEEKEVTLQADGDGSTITEAKISDIRKQMEWFYKGQTLLTVQDINQYCTDYGLDFNHEMGQARDRVELRSELDQTDLTTSDKKSPLMTEFSERAGKLGLDIETEIENSTQRNLLRKEMRNYFLGKSEISVEEIDALCSYLGLNYNYEMEDAKTLPIASEPKKTVKNIATESLARDVRAGSSEIKENSNELVNPVRTTEDKSIDK